MAPKCGKGGSKGGGGGGDGEGDSSYYHPETIRLHPDWGNLAFLVISGIALAAMLPLLIAMFKIKDQENRLQYQFARFQNAELITSFIDSMPDINKSIDPLSIFYYMID